MHPMQAAFKECHGLQCGFCTPGMVMSAIDLVNRHPKASEQTIREELEGNFCRCTGYQNIVKAVQARRRGDGQVGGRHGCHRAKRHRRIDSPQGGLPLPDRVRPVHGRRQSAEPHARVLPALAARAREDPQDRHGEGEGAARRGRHLHRRRSRRRQRPALRLAHHGHRRQADERAAASRCWRRARSATSATRSRW